MISYRYTLDKHDFFCKVFFDADCSRCQTQRRDGAGGGGGGGGLAGMLFGGAVEGGAVAHQVGSKLASYPIGGLG